MNKQELLDKAVREFGGKWPLKTAETSVYSAATHKDFGISFTKEEFQQRARELGYINGYRWSVEYPTNGKKPDLDGDVVVDIRIREWDTLSGNSCVCKWNWIGTVSFRITDQRYKPADTSYLESPTVKESLTDEWYDYDNQKAIALPPAGVECLTWFDDGKECWQKCKVLALSPYEQDHMAVSLIGRYDRKLIWSQDFKPLDHNRKAEAEKKRVVDAAWGGLIGDMNYNDTINILGQLYDAGYLKLPAE